MEINRGEQVLIQAALDFANLAEIKHVDEVHAIFEPVDMVGPVLMRIPQDSIEHFRKDQQELRGWLKRILSRAKADREEVGIEVAKQLETVQTGITFARRRIRLRFRTSGVQACYSYAVALLIDERWGLCNKLFQCAFNGCQDQGEPRFAMAFDGRRKKFCSKQCYRGNDRIESWERVQKWRERHRLRGPKVDKSVRR